jgi:hypothetical protein
MASFESVCKRFGNLLGGVKENIFFLHIPKCGGTSIRQAIRMNCLSLDIRKDRHYFDLDPGATARVVTMTEGTHYPHDASSDYPIMKLRENLLLYSMSQKRTRYISGHFTFSEIAYQKFSGDFSFLTLLRDPVKRWISTYFYNRYKDSDHFKVDLEIEQYLDSDFGRSQGAEYVKFIGGHQASEDYSSAEAVERAKRNLHKFDIVGILEDMDDFKDQFRKRFHAPLNVPTINRNPKPEAHQKAVITPAVEKRIHEICEPDREVYRYARDNFIRRANRGPS